MEFLFKDHTFKFETLRAAGFAVDDGADVSEVLLTAAAIPEGDEEAWMREWKATAAYQDSVGHFHSCIKIL